MCPSDLPGLHDFQEGKKGENQSNGRHCLDKDGVSRIAEVCIVAAVSLGTSRVLYLVVGTVSEVVPGVALPHGAGSRHRLDETIIRTQSLRLLVEYFLQIETRNA